MKKSFLNYLLCGALVLLVNAPGARAFSLLGPPVTSWQVNALGYMLPGEIGTPMGLHEGFRWNVPTITYAFDKSFIDYFGPDGVAAIEEAIQYFNDLETAKKLSSDLSEYSTSTLRDNYEAKELGILDLKSTAMSFLMEELGFADPLRFAFTLRARTITSPPGGQAYTNYTTVMRNFDPVTLAPSPYVNDVLLTYHIAEFAPPPFQYADAVEDVVSGDVLANAPVANAFQSSGFGTIGSFFTGLTRDDVGALRYTLHPNNFANESLLPSVTEGGTVRGDGWIPFVGITNAVTNLVFRAGVAGALSSSNLIVTGLRGGRNHYKFKKVAYDSLLGTIYTPITNSYTDTTFSNFTAVVQQVQRAITQPDIIFVADDNGLQPDGLTPYLVQRTTTATWIDNDAINGADETALSHGPGVIPPQVRISFSNQLPYFQNDNLDNEQPGESDVLSGSFVWGKFDGTTNAPIIFPINQLLSLPQLRQQVLNPAVGQ